MFYLVDCEGLEKTPFLYNRLRLFAQVFQPFAQPAIPHDSRYFPTSLGRNLGTEFGLDSLISGW